MAKKIRFPLMMKDGTAVRTLEELREHFDLESVLGYFADGKLKTWLADRYYDELADKVAALSPEMPDLNAKICEILGVDYFEQEDDTDFEALQRRNEKLRILREITADQNILDNVDAVAFDQDELYDILDEAPAKIYLYGEKFSIPYAKRGITYIGVNNPEVTLEKSGKEYQENEIIFQNVRNDDLKNDEADEPDDSNFNFTIHDAEELILQGKYQEAFPIIQHLAENGDARAMFHMARYYNDGYNTVQIDRAARNAWLEKAFPYHEPLSLHMYSYIVNDDETRWNITDEASELLWELVKSGDVIAQCRYSTTYYRSEGLEPIEKWNRFAANNGYALAQYRLGCVYVESIVFKGGNNHIACEWFKMAAEQGHAPSQYQLAKLLEEKNEDLADKWLRKAADQGHPDAMCALADRYWDSGECKTDDGNDKEAEKDYAAANELYLKAGACGSRDAMRHISTMYRTGDGVEKSHIKAQEWENKYDNAIREDEGI